MVRIGGSWIGESTRAGLSYSVYDSNYGIPGAHGHHEEEHGHDEEHGEDEEFGHEDEEHEEEEEEAVTIDMDSRRWDGVFVGDEPFGGFERLKFNLTYTDYEHTEFEGEEIGTVFEIDTTDGRLELQHNPLGRWNGAFGAQYTDRDFSAVGEEAFVPPSTTETGALFWVESADFDPWRLDLGVRYEKVDTEADDHETEVRTVQFLRRGRMERE